MKKYKIGLWSIIVSPLVLFIIFALLLYVPPVQNWAVKQVAAYVSEHTEWNASVGSVHLAFPLDLSVGELHLTKANDSIPTATDTVAQVRSFVADVKLMPLLQGNVVVDKLELSDVRLNTLSFIPSAQVRGTVGTLSLRSRGISLGHETVDVDYALLKNSNLTVLLNDIVPEDTTSEKSQWAISLRRLHVVNTHADIHMPGDTLRLRCALGDALAQKGSFDIGKNVFTLQRLALKQSTLRYDNQYEKLQKGLDANHIALDDLSLRIDTFSYANNRLALGIHSLALREKCGLQVSGLSSGILLDTVRLQLPSFSLVTPHSKLSGHALMDLNTFADTLPGNLRVQCDGSIGLADVICALPTLKASLRPLAGRVISLKGSMQGNMHSAQIPSLAIGMPGTFSVKMQGWLRHLADPRRLTGKVAFAAQAQHIDFLRRLLPASTASQFRLPNAISAKGQVGINGASYDAQVKLGQGGGTATAKARLNTRTMAYAAHLQLSRFPIHHFLPSYGLHAMSGTLEAKGRGTDLFAPRTMAQAHVHLAQCRVSAYDLSGIEARLNIGHGKAQADVVTQGEQLAGNITLEALLQHNVLNGTLACRLDKADCQKMGLTARPLNVSMNMRLAVESDFKHLYRLQGAVRDISIADSARSYHPEDILVDALTRRDTTYAHVSCGDFWLHLNASEGYQRLLHHSDLIVTEMKHQTEKKYIDQLKLRSYLPTLCLQMSAGGENVFSRTLNHFGIQMASAYIDMDTSPVHGVNGIVKLDSLVAQGIQLDTIRLRVKSDSVRTDFEGQIRNNRHNPQYVFNAQLRGAFYERGLFMGTRVYDADNRLGVSMGMKASMEENGVKLSVGGPFDTVLGYKKFSVNKDNYILFTDDNRISADMQLRASDGTGLQVYSNDSTEALQDITLGLSNFELSRVLTVLPYLPRISGVMNGDFHVIKTEEDLSVSSSVMVSNMTYEGCRMGNVGTEFVYMPKDNGEHFVDGVLSCNDTEVGTISGTYSSEGEGALDANLTLSHTPLSLLNGFITDQLFGFKGYCDGDFSVRGSVSRPDVNGTIRFDSASIASEPYGVEMEMDKTPVKIQDSRLLMNDFRLYAHNRTPLTLNGYLDFSNMDNMTLSTRIQANNYLLIDSRERARSEAYGKAYVNFLAAVNGPLSSLRMRGKLDVLGTTDMTYILRDSPLTTDTQLDDLVKFTSFNSKKEVVVEHPPLTGLDVDLTLSIDEGAHIMCALNTDHSNYVDLIGGGNLRMQYSSVDGIRLTGRYTLNNGEMKYSLPVIPLKTFTIQDGSYVEFFGDAMNPKLNITAVEQTKAQVAEEGGSGRSVAFECGVKITKTLKDMGLEFIIDAPEDLTLHNELQMMTKENRGKLAVTMLTTGMYLADGNTSAFSMNSALSAFLNSQINAISGSALRTLDLSFGMDNTTDGTGATHTDYSFKFSKRFWNNRLRIVVGGKVSSGADVNNQNDTFFDNVTFEYRLSQNSNKYLKLFYDKASYDWLEGNVEQFGAGFMYRRKLQRLTDLFWFKKKSSATYFTQPADTATHQSGGIATHPSGTTATHQPGDTLSSKKAQ